MTFAVTLVGVLAAALVLPWLMRVALLPAVWLVRWTVTARRRVRVDEGAVCYRGRRARLSSLDEVRIVTTSEGPFVPDVFWQLVDADGTVLTIPRESSGDLLPQVQGLPGFDNAAFIDAMTSTDDAVFVCWSARRAADQQADPGDGAKPAPLDLSGPP